ncbi:hypothetical protein, partial [Anaerovibrio slackiae]|uniref:hypothetical protein n=1 Tax=Anaerovibrio slackiae TaxID=2652309 RepID=UPI003869D02D
GKGAVAAQQFPLLIIWLLPECLDRQKGRAAKIEWMIQARSAFSEKTLQRALLLLWEKSAGATL